ncbi:predicted protein [Naegleria gruberi]|uniref:Predicted protein n=1 Tax=Naegleria gruberi TaxID=5762 RepID=D2W3Y9_NAEGR|nr:uncharacterized protein NAEGRDRAFT_76115 [Naegleria gruberi]EFC36220.1 predicted protein [Naegleria gruberi]|eukprot:XP_002668964.1 predicted protein [Naegleria gruberi strain NEG-M]
MITCYRVEEERYKGTGNSKMLEDTSIGKETKANELKVLIDSGLNPLIAMRKCCFVNNLECATYLIDNGIVHINDICEESHNFSWLHYCTHYNSIEIVKYLIENGIDVNIRESRNGNTAQECLTRNIISTILNFCTNQDFLKQFMQEQGIVLKYGENLPILESKFIERVILNKAIGVKIKPLIRIYYMLSILKMIENCDDSDSDGNESTVSNTSSSFDSNDGGETKKGFMKVILEIVILLMALVLVIITLKPNKM